MSIATRPDLADLVLDGTITRELIDRAAMQYALVLIEIRLPLCGDPILRKACAENPEVGAQLHAAAATLRLAATGLHRIDDCGSDEALACYRAVHAAGRPLHDLLLRTKLYVNVASAPGTSRAFRRLEHDAVAEVEAAVSKADVRTQAGIDCRAFFGMPAYFRALHVLDPGIALLDPL